MVYIGQAEIIEFLEECDEPVTRKQIADALNWDPVKVSHILKNLLKWKEVDFIEHARDKASELVGYILLRRTRFFFVVRETK